MKSGAITRLRHFRGHGIHSPFVYSLIRNILMKRHIECERHDLYDELRRRGAGKHWAVQLQNLFCGLHYETFRFLSQDQMPAQLGVGEMCIAGPEIAADALPASPPEGGRALLCLLSPVSGRTRHQAVNGTIESHNGTSIDNRNYVLLFYDQALPKQHFKL